MTTDRRRNVSIEHLKKCKLWAGSIEETADTYCGGLRVGDVQDKIYRLELRDDLTEAEKEYLEALKKTLEEVTP